MLTDDQRQAIVRQAREIERQKQILRTKFRRGTMGTKSYREAMVRADTAFFEFLKGL